MSTPDWAEIQPVGSGIDVAREARARLAEQYIVADRKPAEPPRERIGAPVDSSFPSNDVVLDGAPTTTERQKDFDRALTSLASQLGQGNLSPAALKKLTAPVEALLANADADFNRTPDDLDAANKQVDFDKLSMALAIDHQHEGKVIDAIEAAKPEDRDALVDAAKDYVYRRNPLSVDEERLWKQYPEIFKECQSWVQADDDPTIDQVRQNYDRSAEQMTDSIDFRERYAKVLIDHKQSGLAMELIVERLRMIKLADGLMNERP